MKAGILYCIIFTGFLFANQSVYAKYVLKAKAQPNRLTFHLGYSDQSFAIPTGADFTHVKTNSLGVTFERRRGNFTFGFQYSMLGPADLYSFWINSVTEGKYKITFQRYQLLAGMRTERVRYLVVLGLENSKWEGTPELGLMDKQYTHFGVMWVYDAFARAKFRIPVTATFLSHPGRKYEFSNYPSATIEASGGIEYAIGTGVAFAF